MKVALLNDTSREIGHFGCATVMETINSLCSIYGLNIVYRDSKIDLGFEKRAFLKKIADCQAVILNGEGTLHHDRGEGLLRRASVAREQGKRIHLINSIWQENPRNARYLDSFDSIFVRDPLSLEEIRRDGRSDAKLCPDLVFFMEHVHQPPEREPCIIDSVVNEVTGSLSRFSIETHYPLLFMGRWHRNSFIRRSPWRSFMLKYSNRESLRLVSSLKQISVRSAFVTGRYHGACFAILCGRPFVALPSNSHKMEGLIRYVKLDPSRLIGRPSERISSERISYDVSKTRVDDEYLSIAAEFVKSARPMIRNMFNEIGSYPEIF